MQVTIYHNPRCSKSRATLSLLREHKVEPEVVEYLKTPPTRAQLEQLLTLLGVEPRDIMRKKEAEYRDAGLDDPGLSTNQLLEAIVQHPRLLERPIVVVEDHKAVIGRPPENVLGVL